MSARVVVIGAGAFGGWTALALLRRGARVTLLDAWGPGHARSSSGGETRIMRATYGSRAIYTTLAARALELWREHDARFGAGLFVQTGALWIASEADDQFARASARALKDAGRPLESLSRREAARRYPQMNFAGASSILFEPDAGYLFARRACDDVVRRFVAEGGEYCQAAVASPMTPPALRALRDGRLRRSDGTITFADAFVFACGPWLGSLFPDDVGSLVTPTKQDVFYVGTPAGDTRFEDSRMPVWVDVGPRVMYGIPGNAHRGFKIADDSAGPAFDPTSGSRAVSRVRTSVVRSFLARRFPALARAPIIGTEVCQYEATPDSDFIIDRHPKAPNAWVAGGGSGHGFKMGPAVGEMLAAVVLDGGAPDAAFRLSRFASAPGGRTAVGVRKTKKWN